MKLARASRQQELQITVRPEFKVGKNCMARNAYGAIVEQLACSALKLDHIEIDGSKDVCFDAERNGIFYEIKSCHKNSKVVVYDFRLNKELNTGKHVFYVIVLHKVKGAKTSHELWQMFQNTELEMHVLPIYTIERICSSLPLCFVKNTWKLDQRYGYNRKGYRDGYYNIPTKAIRQISTDKVTRNFKLHGMQFQAQIHVVQNNLIQS
jgi:hypothetical protein